MSLTSFARNVRLGRAIGAALALTLGLFWMMWARAPPTGRGHAVATITKLVDVPVGSDTDCVALIRLDDGREGRVLLPRYAAAEGGRVPLVVEAYANGDTYLVFDVERWMDAASGR